MVERRTGSRLAARSSQTSTSDQPCRDTWSRWSRCPSPFESRNMYCALDGIGMAKLQRATTSRKGQRVTIGSSWLMGGCGIGRSRVADIGLGGPEEDLVLVKSYHSPANPPPCPWHRAVRPSKEKEDPWPVPSTHRLAPRPATNSSRSTTG